MSDIGSTCDLRVEDPSLQVPDRLQTDDSSLLTPIFIRSGVVHMSQVSRQSSQVGRGRSQVYHDGRALVGGATARVSCRYTYDRHARVGTLACLSYVTLITKSWLILHFFTRISVASYPRCKR